KSGLERHPDYVSAHIVHGGGYLDQKNDTAAAQVFRKVLELDPENVLGLKLLAEIAERGGRYEEAAEWLSRRLAADPMNGDAAEALTRTKRKVAQVPAKPMAPPTAKVRVTAPGPKPEFVVEHTREAEPDLPNVRLPLIMPEGRAPPRASEAASAPPGRPALPPPPPPAAPPPPVPAPPAAPMPAAVALSDDDGAADAAALSRAEPV